MENNKPIILIKQANKTSLDIAKINQPPVVAQFVKDGDDGLEPANTQEAFVVEFSSNMGGIAHVTAAPTADQFNALVDMFNSLVAGMEKCHILQRPNTGDNAN